MVKAKKAAPVRSKSPSSIRSRLGGRSARVVSDVLAATLALFAEQGYAGLSIESVAQRARVNKTTVYRRWPSKGELLGAALLSLRNDEAKPPNTGSLHEDLLQLLRQLAKRMETPERRAIMQSLILGNADPEIQALLRRVRGKRPAIAPSIIERAIERGELPQGSDAELITAALLGPLQTRAYLKRQALDESFIRRLVNLVVAGAAVGGALSTYKPTR